MITCYDLLSKRTVLINPRCVVSVEFREDATGKYAEIHIMGEPFMVKVKENAREIEQIKEFFKKLEEE
nr:MAG TPA: Flagellar and Swarming motility protein [Caudoviricetes sp.]